MKKIAIIILCAISIICTKTYAEQAEKVYSFGVVPQFESIKIHQIWRPILDILEQETGYKFNLVGSSNISKFEQEFSQGKFDFAYMNPYHMVMANDYAGYLPIVRDNGRMLYGILVVKKDSDITTPAQLNGQTIAFPSPNALGASLLMRQELQDNFGVSFNSNYVKTHDSVYINVLLGEAAAGGGVQKTLNNQKPQFKEALRIIHKTQEVVPHPIAVLPSVPVEVVNRVREALLKIGGLEQGRQLLEEIPMKKIGPANMDEYITLKEIDLDRFYVAPATQ
ncbi:phosphate/phosphite/phosphonate ABC transporter substrate-binding protein [Shewanella aestuarii]|uniref:Phosphate/phosphite/phosphonate ABC transporter substrate-binding protein n=1 Tax=Shewanella aestuarii TaxID=1028752 RepID=A0A6G9QLS6_9GAMM|nr:phosphate/phosphite/phosphonate ABC transporter substrate-binding protein [Shewanella aestuarii]QIR15496.1 phosphate/phosphite/phosphonate ABC transporter substrate-binding protein [Shewanella aestuarii]